MNKKKELYFPQSYTVHSPPGCILTYEGPDSAITIKGQTFEELKLILYQALAFQKIRDLLGEFETKEVLKNGKGAGSSP